MNPELKMFCWSLWVVALLCCAGCKPQDASPKAPEPKAVSSAPEEEWRKRGAEMGAKMRQGLTDQEVEQLLGKPTRQRTVLSAGQSITTWAYQLSNNAYFVVRFGRDDRALSWDITSSLRVK